MLALALAGPLVAQTTINVHDADIRAFIADAARVTGRIFIIDARVNGKVTVVSERPDRDRCLHVDWRGQR
eukprot:gene47814-64848_t